MWRPALQSPSQVVHRCPNTRVPAAGVFQFFFLSWFVNFLDHCNLGDAERPSQLPQQQYANHGNEWHQVASQTAARTQVLLGRNMWTTWSHQVHHRIDLAKRIWLGVMAQWNIQGDLEEQYSTCHWQILPLQLGRISFLSKLNLRLFQLWS